MKVRELVERLKEFPDWMEVTISFANTDEAVAVSVERRGGWVLISSDDAHSYFSGDCPLCGG